jgi:hypothetical protein
MRVPESKFVQVIGEGAIATRNVGEGRMIPYLLLDCAQRNDVHDLIINHDGQPPGDVISTWGSQRFSSKSVFLHLDFKRPTPANLWIQFDLRKHAMLVDGLMQSNAAYIQANTVAASTQEGLEKPKILIELPPAGGPFDWAKLYEKTLRKQFRREGQTRRDAAANAKVAIAVSRQFWTRPNVNWSKETKR